jgi:anhydro-N-acetylmuramic acid kinase
MSGTSHDGIDAALVELSRSHGRLRVWQRGFRTFSYPRAVRERLLRLSQGATVNAGEVSQVNFLLGELFARAALRLCRIMEVTPAQVNAIGSHGHTIYHRPRQRPSPGSTLQIAEAAVIAGRTGITTVADFRPADVAAQGEGAPLVPYVHHALFQQSDRAVAVHNIGGIANLTYLPAGRGVESLLAFDSGPGNMVIDGVTQAVSGGKKLYDRNGQLARSGTVHTTLLADLLGHPYFTRRPPKSTGREEFGEPFICDFLRQASRLHLNAADQVATATALTAESMGRAYRKFVLSRGPLDEVLLTGGGRLNPVLRAWFARALPDVRVRAVEEVGYDSKALEAVAFAVLAYATLHGLPANVPGATGACEPRVVGKVVPGANYRGTRLG